jgi:hypothetical protein
LKFYICVGNVCSVFVFDNVFEKVNDVGILKSEYVKFLNIILYIACLRSRKLNEQNIFKNLRDAQKGWGCK